jgi:small subunit ribosomal protein S17e
MMTRLDKTRSLSEMILKRYPNAFSGDYEKNKEVLDGLAIIPSKHLRNHIAGYISKVLKRGEEAEEEPAEPEEPKAE